MKKILFTLTMFVTVLLYSACDSLNLAPEDYYGNNSFWNNTAQVNGFMTGLHNNLRDRYTMFYVLGEVRGGTLKDGTSALNTSLDYSNPYIDNQFSADNTGISNWYNLYNNIMQVNHFIEEVEGGCSFLSDSDRKFYLGQAYGLRALYYFSLYRTYGGVPLISTVKVMGGNISADKLYTPRSTPEEIMNFIKDDLKKSEDNFGSNMKLDRSMWSAYATQMLKADVYLWSAKVTTGDHTKTGDADLNVAKSALNSLIGKFTLQKDFSDVFQKKSNDEVIFAIRFKDTEATNWAYNFVYASTGFVDVAQDVDGNTMKDVLDTKATGLLRHEYKEALWRSYDVEDSRRDKTFLNFYMPGAKKEDPRVFGLVMRKAMGIVNSNNSRVYETDVIVYRYSEVLLMLAEIENAQNGDPAKYINEVRQRAYGEKWSTAFAYTNGTFAENELAILHEKDKEFVWEGKRWFDIVRMHDDSGNSLAFSAAANYVKSGEAVASPLLKSTETFKLLWPIDRSTLNNDKELKQTPGYEDKK